MKNMKYIVAFLLTFSVISCATQPSQLMSKNKFQALKVANEILVGKNNFKISKKDLRIYVDALASEYSSIRDAAKKALLQTGPSILPYMIQNITNRFYWNKKLEKKASSVLSSFASFPDSLEKVEFLALIAEHISSTDPDRLKNLMDIIEEMNNRIPENKTSDHTLIKFFKWTIRYKSDASLSNQILNFFQQNRSDKIKLHAIQHLAYAFNDVNPLFPIFKKALSTLHDSDKRASAYATVIDRLTKPRQQMELLRDFPASATQEFVSSLIQSLPNMKFEKGLPTLINKARERIKSLSGDQKFLLQLELATNIMEINKNKSDELIEGLQNDFDLYQQALAFKARHLIREGKTHDGLFFASMIFSPTLRQQIILPEIALSIARTNKNAAFQWASSQHDSGLSLYIWALYNARFNPREAIKFFDFDLSHSGFKPSWEQKVLFTINLSERQPSFAEKRLQSLFQSVLQTKKDKLFAEKLVYFMKLIQKTENISKEKLVNECVSASSQIKDVDLRTQILSKFIPVFISVDMKEAAKYFGFIHTDLLLEAFRHYLNLSPVQPETEIISTLLPEDINLTTNLIHIAQKDKMIRKILVRTMTNIGRINDNIGSPDTNDEKFAAFLVHTLSTNWNVENYKQILTLATNTRSDILFTEYLTLMKNWIKEKSFINDQSIWTSILKSKAPTTLRAHAAEMLGLYHNNAEVQALREQLKNKRQNDDVLKAVINSLTSLQDKESAEKIFALFDKSSLQDAILQSLVAFKNFDLLKKAYSRSSHKTKIAALLSLNFPERRRIRKLAYIGPLYPALLYMLQKKSYPVIPYKNIKEAEADLCERFMITTNIIKRDKVGFEYTTVKGKKNVFSETHTIKVRLLSKDKKELWSVKAIGFSSPWAQGVVQDLSDPQTKVSDLAEKAARKSLKNILKAKENSIPLNFN